MIQIWSPGFTTIAPVMGVAPSAPSSVPLQFKSRNIVITQPAIAGFGVWIAANDTVPVEPALNECG